MRLPDVVLGAVVYLGARMVPGFRGCALEYVGSGFIVSAKHKGTSFYYLVTADHVAKKLWGYPDPIARMNDIHGNSFETELRDISDHDADTIEKEHGIKVKRDPWVRHPDPTVDLAVLDFTPWDHNAPHKADGRIPMRGIAHAPDYMLVEDAQFSPNGIGVGDEVYIAGLFGFASGDVNNSPILRVGNLTMIPQERIDTGDDYGEMEAYLIEARSIGGLSGGLVLVRETVPLKAPKGPYDRFDQRKPQFHASGKFYVLGCAQGHWDIPAPQLNDVEPDAVGKKQGVNIGIAIVTPARKIRDIIHGEHFTQHREETVTSINRGKKRNLPVQDSAEPAEVDPQERFDRATSALFQVPKDAVDAAEAQRPKRTRKSKD